jgi:hypothetical protein
MHLTKVTPSGPAPTVRMNRDSLHSAAIVDTSTGMATIALPEGDLYQSVMMVDTEGYARKFILKPGTHPVVTDTPFVWLLVRTGLEKGQNEAWHVPPGPSRHASVRSRFPSSQLSPSRSSTIPSPQRAPASPAAPRTRHATAPHAERCQRKGPFARELAIALESRRERSSRFH